MGDDIPPLSSLQNQLRALQLQETAAITRNETTISFNESTVNSTISFKESTVNYVGALQEFCVKRHLPQPVYSDEFHSGPDHAPTFGIKCVLGNFEVVGSARGKKDAKQDAARKMFDIVNGTMEEEKKTEAKISKGLNDSLGSTVLSLNYNDIPMLENPKHILDIVCHEADVKQKLVESTLESGQKICYLTLNVRPDLELIVYGTAETSDDAQTSAFRSALTYLKRISIMRLGINLNVSFSGLK